MPMADERKMIQFTPDVARRLKAAYVEACKTKQGCDTFLFDGHEFVLGYAKYLIEFLEMKKLL